MAEFTPANAPKQSEFDTVTDRFNNGVLKAANDGTNVANAFNSSGVLKIANGGSGMTEVSSTTATSNGFTAYCSKWGPVVSVRITGTSTKALDSGTTIVTLPSGYRPPGNVRVTWWKGSNTSAVAYEGNIASTGVCTIWYNMPSGAGMHTSTAFIT